jgi:hypothetical protein
MTTELTEKTQVDVEATELTSKATALVIVTNDDRIFAEDLSQLLKKAEDALFAEYDPPRAKAYENYQYHKNRLDVRLNPVKDARKALKNRIMAWDDEQERIRREEQRRLDEEARKKAEEETLAMAAQAEAEGDKEAAEALLEAPLDVPSSVVPKAAPAASRITAGRTQWYAELVNFMALVKAVAEGKAPITFLQANMTNLNSRAKADKEHFSVPGVRARNKRV